MSHSTTATTTHILLKYSRSHPLASDPNGSQGPNAEWQHYVNPVIHLVLDVKKSSNGELESFRLRILWSMTELMDIEHREMVFEDLDLLSFSTPMSHSSQQKSIKQGLPLRAVYRDAVVGIRYLHRPNNANCAGTYRRFQITFQSTVAASQFIDAIRYVCPCKVNPTPALARAATVKKHVPDTLPRKEMLGLPNFNAYSQVSRPQAMLQTTSIIPTSCHLTTPSQIEASAVPFLITEIDHSSRPTTSSSIGNLKRTWDSDSPLAVERLGNARSLPGPLEAPYQDVSALPDLCLSSNGGNSSVILPATRLTCSSSDSQATAGCQSRPAQEPQITPSHDALIASLHESPKLYDISQVELEKLVGEVIREDGFLNLLENLDTMWRVKSFLAQ